MSGISSGKLLIGAGLMILSRASFVVSYTLLVILNNRNNKARIYCAAALTKPIYNNAELSHVKKRPGH